MLEQLTTPLTPPTKVGHALSPPLKPHPLHLKLPRRPFTNDHWQFLEGWTEKNDSPHSKQSLAQNIH